jgi:putative transposase
MRYSQACPTASFRRAEKMGIIRMVEGSALSVTQTLRELDVNNSSFYEWYGRYRRDGYDGLAGRKPTVRRFWNLIPDHEKEHVVAIALEHPEQSPRQLEFQ